MQARLGELGSEPVGSTPEELAQLIQQEVAVRGKVIKESGISSE